MNISLILDDVDIFFIFWMFLDIYFVLDIIDMFWMFGYLVLDILFHFQVF